MARVERAKRHLTMLCKAVSQENLKHTQTGTAQESTELLNDFGTLLPGNNVSSRQIGDKSVVVYGIAHGIPSVMMRYRL